MKDAPLAANAHSVHTLIEARNQPAHTLREGHRLWSAVLGIAIGAEYRLAVLIEFRWTGWSYDESNLWPSEASHPV